ncbi:hypothetical protein SPJ2_0853 [Streptococcus parauberis KRS-02109]|nr:hypothetical protein SPJ2_0853 [Streptococcus parauberis KRS-02109]
MSAKFHHLSTSNFHFTEDKIKNQVKEKPLIKAFFTMIFSFFTDNH